MKFLLPILFTLLSFCASSQNYYPMLKENKTWETYGYIPFQPLHLPDQDWSRFYLNGDSIVNGKTYYKIYSHDTLKFYSPPPVIYPAESHFTFSLIREDSITKKVWGIPWENVLFNNDTNEYLIYDFSVVVGDTMRSIKNEHAPGYPLEYSNAIVDSIKPYILDNGDTTRIFYITPLDFGVLINPYFVIEGVGGHNDFFYPFQTVFEGDAYISCVKDNSIGLYNKFGGCGIIQNINDNNQNSLRIEISPNPNSGIFTIKSEESTRIKLYNMQGKLIKNINSKSIYTTINIESQPSGIYFLKATFEDGSIKTKKLVVN